MVLEMILPICYCSIQKCQWKIWHIRQNDMSPVRHFLLEDVSYARCGRDDVVALKKDGTVWTWGMIWNYQSTGYCITMPQQILTDVKMIHRRMV